MCGTTGWAQHQVLGRDLLAGGLGGVDVEDEVGAIGIDVVVQLDLQFDADHGGRRGERLVGRK